MADDDGWTYRERAEERGGEERRHRDRLYPPVDSIALGQHYINHVEAMTAEGLHEKSAIAAQLAWRDAELARLRGEVAAATDLIERAVRNADRPRGRGSDRWAYVKQTFAVGSTRAKELCRRFNLDPDATQPQEWLDEDDETSAAGPAQPVETGERG